MSTTSAPPERHIHLDLDVDPERNFHYRSLGGDGHRVVLHRGDTITFTCNDEFCVRFAEASPFTTPVLYARHLFITARVRDDARPGAYPYTIEVTRGEQAMVDPASQGQHGVSPEIVVENIY